MQELHSIQIEQNLLGCLLVANKTYFKFSQFLRPEHFFHEEHQKIFETAANLINAGKSATAITLSHQFADLKEYIAQLEVNAVGLQTVRDYADAILDLWQRRRMIEILDETKEKLIADENDEQALQLSHKLAAQLVAINEIKKTEKRAAELIDEIANAAEHGAAITSTGYSRLDKLLIGGFHASRLYCFAARMKHGKSTMMSTIAYNMAVSGAKILYICLESSGREVMAKILGRDQNCNANDFVDIRKSSMPDMKERLKNAKEKFGTIRLSFEDSPAVDLNSLLAKLYEAGATEKYDGVFVDYIQLVTGKTKNETDAAFEARVVQRVAEVVKRYPKMWICTAAQINRSENGDVRGSDGIRMACDMLIKIAAEEDGNETLAHLEIMASRYTPIQDLGSKEKPSYQLVKDIGPYYQELR